MLRVMRLRFPRYIPPPPIPAITLPTMSASMVGAAPQMALPTAKVVTLLICSHLTLKMLYALPLCRQSVAEVRCGGQGTAHSVNMVAIDPKGNPLPSQASFEISPKDSITAD